jgi:hypothetical protein
VALRAELKAIVTELLAASEGTRAIALDAIGEAIGTRAITPEEIEGIMKALEAAGRSVVGPAGGDGEARLKAVLTAARELRPALGRAPTVGEIAARSGLEEEQVRHALALAKVMQR